MKIFSRMKKGFTLVELLLVVAIIGILLSVIAVALGEASDRGRNSKIITSTVQVMKIAEQIYINEGSSYEKLCSGHSSLNTDISDIGEYGNDLKVLQEEMRLYGGNVTCYSESSSYCIDVEMLGKTNKWFCIDDEGNAVEVSNSCSDANDTCQ